MPDASFESSKRLCTWALQEIENFDSAEVAFMGNDPYQIVSEPAYSAIGLPPAPVSFKVVDIKEPGEEFERTAYRIILDLRNALDQAVSAASEMIGSGSPSHTNFPFAMTEKDFNRRLAASKGVYRGIPTKLHPLLQSFRPFLTNEDGTNGERLLCFLNDIANINKHKVTLETLFSPKGVGIINCHGFNLVLNCQRISDTEFSILKATPFAPDAQITIEVTAEFRISHWSPFTDQPAGKLFKKLHALVESIVLKIEEEALKITD